MRGGPKSDLELRGTTGYRALEARKKLGLTQEQLATAAGCTRVSISNYENGRTGIGTGIVVGLCRALQITPNDLYGWDEKPYE